MKITVLLLIAVVTVEPALRPSFRAFRPIVDAEFCETLVTKQDKSSQLITVKKTVSGSDEA